MLSRWGDVSLLGAVGGGARNEVREVEVDGRRCVARVGSRTGDELAWELDLIGWLGEHEVGVPAVVSTTEGEREHSGVVLFEWIDGHHPDSQDEWVAVRDLLVGLHAVTGSWPQRPGFRAAVDLLDADIAGDVDLTVMPPDAVERCRRAWARLAELPRTVVHGDPGRTNILISDGRPVLIDWDEARVDTPWFDLAALPDAVSPLDEAERWVARQAASAWEAAVSWTAEPAYAHRRLDELE